MIGFISTRLKSIPNASIAAILNIISLGAYLIGYLAWWIGTCLYPNHPKLQDSWYGFAEFKYQYQAAALLGFFATFIIIISATLTILATWMYAISNLLWVIGEHHKGTYQEIQSCDHQSIEKQSLYFRFVLLVTIGSIVTAGFSTAAFLIPQAAFLINQISSAVGILFMCTSLYYLKKYTFYTPVTTEQPLENIRQSHQILAERLSPRAEHLKLISQIKTYKNHVASDRNDAQSTYQPMPMNHEENPYNASQPTP